MKTNRLEIAIEKGSGDLVVLLLSGIFYREALPMVKGTVQRLVEDGYRRIAIEMQWVELRDPEIREGFISIFNDMKGRGGDIVLLSHRDDLLQYFASIRNLIDIYPSLADYRRSGFWSTLRRQGVAYSKKTGVRLSFPMAVILLALVTGWLATLVFNLFSQKERLDRQQQLIAQLEGERLELEREYVVLQQKLAPLAQLGLTSDSLTAADYHFTSDWIDHLEERFRRKQVADSLASLDSTAVEIDTSALVVEVAPAPKKKGR